MGTVQFLGRTLFPVGALDRKLLVVLRTHRGFRPFHHPEGALGLLEEALQGRGEEGRVARVVRSPRLRGDSRDLHQHLLYPGLQDPFLFDGILALHGRPPLRQQALLWAPAAADSPLHPLRAQRLSDLAPRELLHGRQVRIPAHQGLLEPEEGRLCRLQLPARRHGAQEDSGRGLLFAGPAGGTRAGDPAVRPDRGASGHQERPLRQALCGHRRRYAGGG